MESELFSAEAVFGQQEQELKLLEKVSYHAGALGVSVLDRCPERQYVFVLTADLPVTAARA